jgi:hypothetical protein
MGSDASALISPPASMMHARAEPVPTSTPM